MPVFTGMTTNFHFVSSRGISTIPKSTIKQKKGFFVNIKSSTIAVVSMLIASIAQAQGPSREELDMVARSPEYRVVAEQFVTAAAARDSTKLEKMLSPAITARTGKEGVQKFLNGQIVPFFADYKEIGRSVTTTNTTDASGNAGFAYYMYSVPKSGQPKPFVIYVLEENGQKVVGNILVNRFVEGRHK
jgi:hypothetical protein